MYIVNSNPSAQEAPPKFVKKWFPRTLLSFWPWSISPPGNFKHTICFLRVTHLSVSKKVEAYPYPNPRVGNGDFPPIKQTVKATNRCFKCLTATLIAAVKCKARCWQKTQRRILPTDTCYIGWVRKELLHAADDFNHRGMTELLKLRRICPKPLEMFFKKLGLCIEMCENEFICQSLPATTVSLCRELDDATIFVHFSSCTCLSTIASPSCWL